MFRRGKFQYDIFLSAEIALPRFVRAASPGRAHQLIRCGLSHDPHSSLAGSSRICTCLRCLSNCRCMVLIAASGFLANPGPPNVKYLSQLEHLPCSPDLSFWVISRCGFFMHQVSHSQDSRTSPVDFKLYHYPFWLGSSDRPLGHDLRLCDVSGMV
jgi:hypothetical protein